LERGQRPTWRKRGSLAGAALLAALSAATVIRGAGRREVVCHGGAARLAGVWEGPADDSTAGGRRDAVKAALLVSGVPSPEEIWERVASALDRYASQWLAMYGKACEDTLVRHTQSATVMDLRMTCLEERRRGLAALSDVLAKAGRDV